MIASTITGGLMLAIATLHVQLPPPPDDMLYNYEIKAITNVIDGDTLVGTIAVGFYNMRIHEARLRLARIDAPEMRGPERPQGIEARAFMGRAIAGKRLIVQHLVKQKDPFGRLIVEVWADGVNLSDLMVREGHAVYEDY